ncbi:polysaccharide deacetylase family protein [Alkaliphilus peptidifermentans]|uniref:Polysaccharide deacetylase family sporulation protein PdaB n=1 Tax=Alkaliphilus peptidifermentans DSM 18978 TaxID=1120976 RepID=A0A1G5KLG7_9FIRM|nr:polysaccharide deacetylase family protein [Alkaliphilus peptidifermentans]SCZ00799.1 polysaccharide deacetylase family sporulation protein PdaB [Alkaliphilus peptidifermentans DSM 18978]
MNKLRSIIVFVLVIAFTMTPLTSHAAMVHRVSPGETMFLIAQKYGVTLDELVSKNKFLSDPGRIFNRQLLVVPQPPKKNIYIVQPNDTLFKISQKLGLTINNIVEANQIKDINRLYVGQELSLPVNNTPESSATVKNNYTIKNGDTLYKIAQQHGVSIDTLVKVNSLENINMIYVGQELQIPKKDTAATPVKKQPEANFQYSLSQLRNMYPNTIHLKGNGNDRKIALTFDDGPNPAYTQQILDILKEHDVPATFFIMGSRAERFPNIVKRAVAEGHTIGNHTWNHPDLRKNSNDKIREEIKMTEDTISEITGLRTAIMRPPYGAISVDVVETLIEKDYKIINWSVDSVDWRDKNADKIIINTLSDISSNDIVLFHDSSGEGVSMQPTVDSLPELIETLKMHGYTFVTVDELLNIQPYK